MFRTAALTACILVSGGFTAMVNGSDGVHTQHYQIMGKITAKTSQSLNVEGREFYLSSFTNMYSQAQTQIRASQLVAGDLVCIEYRAVGNRLAASRVKLMDAAGSTNKLLLQGVLTQTEDKRWQVDGISIQFDAFTILLGEDLETAEPANWQGLPVVIAASKRDDGKLMAEIMRQSKSAVRMVAAAD